MLPVDSIQGNAINYPIGTNNFEKLFHKKFQRDIFTRTPQFYFMGQNDDTDAIPYSDAYDEDERELIYHLIGEEMQPQRWNYCKDYYRSEGINVVLKTYDNTGHRFTENIKEEIISFFKDCIKNE